MYFGDERIDPNDDWTKDSFDELSEDNKLAIFREKIKWNPVQDVNLVFSSDNNKEVMVVYRQPETIFSSGRNSFIANVGYCEEPVTQIIVTLPRRGLYTWDSLDIYQISMEGLEEKIAALEANSLTDITFDVDVLSGTLALDKSKILCIAIPYSKGWHAFIDGTEVEALCVNKRYIGMNAPEGRHAIEIHYSAPYKKKGFALTCLGFVLLGFLAHARKQNAQKLLGRNAAHAINRIDI